MMGSGSFFAILLWVATAASGQAISQFSGGTEYPVYYGGSTGDVVGWSFSVSEEIEVTDLGVWDRDHTGGIDSPHPVGIWDGDQYLVTSATVLVGGTVVGDWIYAGVSPVVLEPGETYTIGTLYASDDDDFYITDPGSVTTAAEITWLNSVHPSATSLGFTFPGSSSSTEGRFGPNFIFSEAALEHSTWGAIKTVP